jgi:hypothetical protein
MNREEVRVREKPMRVTLLAVLLPAVGTYLRIRDCICVQSRGAHHDRRACG